MNLLVEEAEDLATGLLPAALLVVHDAVGGGKHHVAELPAREEVGDPVLDLVVLAVETRRDHTALVDAAGELHHDLTPSVVVHNGELANVTVLLHDLQELHDHLRARADEHLALSPLLRIVDRLEAVGEHADLDHGGGCCAVFNAEKRGKR
eukprot:CAMPEP_0205920004 /NCGR_PEP_ID=MMETSP1325-20131115/10802_1 /ASSEMBLY_ACC=CAM_ASM_000708 /TAXON_ID=236786 /ORGANISM="Florenciella sp., Strain RCC1007" /LENGTH=150 /DNA_ID=CAMNT_0053287655 /DNA_START=136 /DNA_END=586 /DNA_ORIENTATION=-